MDSIGVLFEPFEFYFAAGAFVFSRKRNEDIYDNLK